MKHFLIVFFLWSLLGNVFAQDTLRPDEIFILKEYNPVIATEGPKLSDLPQLIKLEVPKKEVNFSFIPREYQVIFKPESIAPATMKREPLDKIHKGYVRVGAGTYLTSLADVYYSSTRSSKKTWGIDLHHKGFFSTIRDKGYAGFLGEKVKVFGDKLLDDYKLSGFLDFQYDQIHYYGYDPVFFTQFDAKNTRQHYISPSVGFSVSNLLSRRDSSISIYQFDVQYKYLQDAFLSKEHRPVVKGLYQVPLQRSQFRVQSELDFNQFTVLDSSAQNSFIFALKPQFVTKYDYFELDLGLSFFLDNTAAQTKPSVKPNIQIKAPLFDNLLTPYLGAGGGVYRNNFESIRKENPFIHSQYLQLLNKNVRYSFYAGLKSVISSKIQLDIQAMTQQVDQHPLFINDTFGIVNHYFLLIYDQINIHSIQTEFTYLVNDRWSLFSKLDLYSYKTLHEDDAWHLPTVKWTFSSSYDLYQKFLLRADMFYVGSRFAELYGYSSLTGNLTQRRIEQLHSYVDLNIMGEYRYTHRLGAFVQILNAFGRRYERFYNYPAQSIGVVGGIKWLFE